jgi:hypothetical protein
VTTPLEAARAELDKEYAQFREKLGELLVAMADVERAGPTDDVHGLLETLEDKVHKARTGGLFGSGAKGHRSAREKWLEAGGR